MWILNRRADAASLPFCLAAVAHKPSSFFRSLPKILMLILLRYCVVEQSRFGPQCTYCHSAYGYTCSVYPGFQLLSFVQKLGQKAFKWLLFEIWTVQSKWMDCLVLPNDELFLNCAESVPSAQTNSTITNLPTIFISCCSWRFRCSCSQVLGLPRWCWPRRKLTFSEVCSTWSLQSRCPPTLQEWPNSVCSTFWWNIEQSVGFAHSYELSVQNCSVSLPPIVMLMQWSQSGQSSIDLVEITVQGTATRSSIVFLFFRKEVKILAKAAKSQINGFYSVPSRNLFSLRKNCVDFYSFLHEYFGWWVFE